MNVYEAFNQLSERGCVVSIGTFDGVHVGHQRLLHSALRRAVEVHASFFVVTFEPPPAQVIRPETFPGRLVTPQRKLDLLRESGVGATLSLRFDDILMRMTPERFLGNLAEAVQPVELWVGEEFALGHGRRGDVKRLQAIGSDLGFQVIPVERVRHGGEIVSSSRIRTLVASGAVHEAGMLLGRPFRISGEVIEGAKIGRTIGYPTANVAPLPELVPLPDGIYVSLAGLPGEPVQRPAMTYIGTRPALNSGSRLIETHLLDFSGDLYGQMLATDFLQRIRPDATFDTVDALIEQLRDDERVTRKTLADFGVAPHPVT